MDTRDESLIKVFAAAGGLTAQNHAEGGPLVTSDYPAAATFERGRKSSARDHRACPPSPGRDPAGAHCKAAFTFKASHNRLAYELLAALIGGLLTR